MILHDLRTGCLSAMLTTTVSEYMKLVETVYENRGGIEGQRAPLKTKTGIRIRKRMVSDISDGAILPPLVLGGILTEEEFKSVSEMTEPSQLFELMSTMDSDLISIIDGMQRTTAILEANKNKTILQNPLRVELWLAKSINSLIYRMLVLNTGQVPWDMKRQLETIYQPILKEIKKSIPDMDILLLDDSSRRVQASQQQGHKVVELFLAFTSRKINVDIKEKVAEDFARMEASEATAKEDFLKVFIHILGLLNQLDRTFDLYRKDDDSQGRIRGGKDIFTSAPAGIGFVAAASVFIYGPPGFSLDDEKIKNNLSRITDSVKSIVTKIELLNKTDNETIGGFLDLLSLNEKLETRSGKVGDFEREFFMKAFGVLFEYGSELDSLEPCWAAR